LEGGETYGPTNGGKTYRHCLHIFRPLGEDLRPSSAQASSHGRRGAEQQNEKSPQRRWDQKVWLGANLIPRIVRSPGSKVGSCPSEQVPLATPSQPAVLSLSSIGDDVRLEE
jgi:hypothetical protein